MTQKKKSIETPTLARWGDFDPEDIPVRMAATVLILDQRPDLQVLMLKRNARSNFVGDMWVFPGGAVDPADASPRVHESVDGLNEEAASAALDLRSGGLAYWVAALRETFEEAGLMLTSSPNDLDLSVPDTAARFDRHRDALNAGDRAFLEIVSSEDITLDGSGVHYVGRWVTPVGPPRRYDTRFFVTAMPAGQVPLHDNDEAVHHEWVRPSDAVAANATDEMLMLTPTVAMLQRLALFSNADAAMGAAASGDRLDEETIRIRSFADGPARIAFPADVDYAEADPHRESGTVRWPVPPA